MYTRTSIVFRFWTLAVFVFSLSKPDTEKE